MKKLMLLLIFPFVIFSCNKDYLVPGNEVPGWLKTKIRQDEQKISDTPKLMYAYGAWLRYRWQNEYYFEYHNVLSSSSPIPISFNGDTLHINAWDINTDYYKEKCCKQYVWKAPEYDEFPGI
jgi:hypothetical protein